MRSSLKTATSACRLKVWHTTFNRENAGSIPAKRI